VQVKQAVVAAFPPSEQAEVFYALDTCQLGPVGDGVRLDILVLANGDIEKFRRVVELAKLDPRDLFAAAQEKRQAMTERSRRLGLPVPASRER
jgi:hypothetical protein